MTAARTPLLLDPTLNLAFLLSLAAASVVVGVYLFARGFRLLSRKRLIENTPTSTARAAAMGPVEIHGRAVGPYGLISPLSELDCYYYAASIWRQYEGPAQSAWEKVGEEVLCVPFFIADETGSILIDPRGAELDLPPMFDEEEQPYGSEMARHFVSRHHAEGILKLKEVVIQPGDSLYVFGTLGNNHIANAMIGGSEFGETNTRVLSREAADLQRRMAFQMMRVEPPEGPLPDLPAESCDLNSSISLQKGDGRRSFVIAAHSERELLGELGAVSTRNLWAGPVLILIGLGILIWRLTPQ